MENSPSIKSIAYPYGGILAAVSILMLIVVYVFNINQDNLVLSIITFIINIAIFVMAIKTFKDKNLGFLSLSEALKTGMAVAAIGGIIVAIYSYIHYNFIYTEFTDIALENARTSIMENQPNMSDEQIEQALSYSEFFVQPFFLSTMALISSLFFGFIISLITGLIMKRKNPALEG